MGLVNRFSIFLFLGLLFHAYGTRAETCEEAVELLNQRHRELSGSESQRSAREDLYQRWNSLHLQDRPDAHERRIIQKLLDEDRAFDFYWNMVMKAMTRGRPKLRHVLGRQYFEYRLTWETQLERLREQSPGGVQAFAPMIDVLDDYALFALYSFSNWLDEPRNEELLQRPWAQAGEKDLLVVYDTSVVGHSRNQRDDKFGRVIERKRYLSRLLFDGRQIGTLFVPPATGPQIGSEMYAARMAHLPLRNLPSFDTELSEEEFDVLDRMTAVFMDLHDRLGREKQPRHEYVVELNALAVAQVLFEEHPTIFITQNSSQFLSIIAGSVSKDSYEGLSRFEESGFAEFYNQEHDLTVEVERLRQVQGRLYGRDFNRAIVMLRVIDGKTDEVYETQFVSLPLDNLP